MSNGKIAGKKLEFTTVHRVYIVDLKDHRSQLMVKDTIFAQELQQLIFYGVFGHNTRITR